jgi:regulator of replication initiation timing
MSNLFNNLNDLSKDIANLRIKLKRLLPTDKALNMKTRLNDIIIKLDMIINADQRGEPLSDREVQIVSIHDRLCNILEPLFQKYFETPGDMQALPPDLDGLKSSPNGYKKKIILPDLKVYKCPALDTHFRGLRLFEGESCISCHRTLVRDTDF